MSREEPTEKQLNNAYQLGVSEGWREAGGLLMKRATESFSNGNDKEAFLLRTIGGEFIKTSEGKHPGVTEGRPRG